MRAVTRRACARSHAALARGALALPNMGHKEVVHHGGARSSTAPGSPTSMIVCQCLATNEAAIRRLRRARWHDSPRRVDGLRCRDRLRQLRRHDPGRARPVRARGHRPRASPCPLDCIRGDRGGRLAPGPRARAARDRREHRREATASVRCRLPIRIAPACA